MADDANKDGAEGGGKKKLPMMMLIVIGGVMLVEGAVLGGLWFMFSGQPEAALAETLEDDALAEQEELVEVLLIGDKFQNTRQGSQAYLYDATIYLLVRRKNQVHVEEEIEANIARVREEVSQIFSRAEPAHLNEPERQTLKRQIKAKCDSRFGDDPDGEPYVTDVIISDWKRFSTDL